MGYFLCNRRTPWVFSLSARYSATYRSEPKNVPIARQAVATFARSCGFTAQEVSEIEIAAGEALNNASEHSRNRQGGTFYVRCECEGETLTIEVRDSGRGFQREAKNDVPGSELPARGFGMSIMRAMMNEITYSNNGTVIRLVRRRKDAREGNGNSGPG